MHFFAIVFVVFQLTMCSFAQVVRNKVIDCPNLKTAFSNPERCIGKYYGSFGRALESSDENILQIVGNVITTFVADPVLANHKTNLLTQSIFTHGHNVVKYIANSATTAIITSRFLRETIPKLGLLRVKLEKKCGVDNVNKKCTSAVLFDFTKRVLRRYSKFSSNDHLNLRTLMIVAIHNTNEHYVEIVENLFDLFFQYLDQFVKHPDFNNLVRHTIPIFMEKSISILEEHNMTDFFAKMFKVTDSPQFGVIMTALIEDFSMAIDNN